MVKKVKCPQMKCGYNIMGGCRNCKLCDCEPNVINEDCDICWNCSMDEGILRWDDKTNDTSEDDSIKNKEDEVKQELKPIEVKAKAK